MAVTQGIAPLPLVAGTRITIDFSGERFGLSAGCNMVSGQWTVDGGRLVTRDVSMTAVGCSPELDAQDTWLIAFVGSGPAASVAGDALVLATDTTTIELLDRRSADPDRPLVGRTWKVGTIASAGAAHPGNGKATLEFSDAGRVTIDTGCNTGTADYAIKGQTMRFANVALTKRACAAGDKPTEDIVVGVLRMGAVTYRIEANELTLSTPDPAIYLFTE